MGRTKSSQTDYGPGKYAAFHLLLGVWIRRYIRASTCVYVTLGGTELRDIRSLAFINQQLAGSIFSFELAADRYELACAARDRLASEGIIVSCIEGSIFAYERESDAKHLFFVDLEGICTPEYAKEFGALLKSNTLREGDGLLITSHLGHNPGYVKRVFQWFRREYDWLGVVDEDIKRQLYRSAHASFVLYRALEDANLIDEISLECFGSIQYHDTSPMGLYGYILAPGRTQFTKFLERTPSFSIPRQRYPLKATE